MEVNSRTIPANQFRDRCLELLDEVHAAGEKLIVTKHRRLVAVIVPAVETPGRRIIGWSDDIRIETDLTKPAVPPDDWHIVSNPERVLTGIATNAQG